MSAPVTYPGVGCPTETALQACVDGDATRDERAAIADHARSCAACRDVLALAERSGSEPAAPTAPIAPLRSGTRVDRFVVDGVLGAGGMGVVYAAFDPELDRRVALKLLRDESPGRRERLAREAQALARAADPNVCAVYDLGSHDGRLFVAMELVDGDTLGAWLRRRHRSWREVAGVFAAAARGLAAAHGAGVIHRDFKPDNVLVGADGRVRVTDFGLATWRPAAATQPAAPARAEPAELTQSGTVLGTPLYMAPEQHTGASADERSDQWSFCAALHEALCGEPPVIGRSEAELHANKLAGPPPRLPGTPRWLDRLVRRGLAPRPGDRWPTMARIADALARRPQRRRTWALAAFGALAAAAVAVALVARARGPDLEAARMAALAEAMEAGLRIEHVAPPHDLRPALARIRAEVDRLRLAAAQGSGPASFAFGKALELLGDDDAARTAYQRAWVAGFRIPRVADGLGSVLSSLYQREYSKARATLARPALDTRLAALHAELAVPATQYLALGGGEPWRVAMHRAAIALLAHEFAAARAAAAEALAADPGRYEALVLEAQAWRSEALAHADTLGQREPLAHALEAAEAAARYGRSDQRVALLQIDVQWSLVLTHTRRGESSADALTALLAAIDRAGVLDPDAPRLLLSRARVLRLRGQTAAFAGAAGTGPPLDDAIRTLRRAAELDGGDPVTLKELAQDLALRAHDLTLAGNDDAALPLVDEGLRTIDRVVAREPQDPVAWGRIQQLHETKGVALRRHHKAQYFDELRRAVAAGEQAVRLGAQDAAKYQVLAGQDLVYLAEDAWQSGRDPRPEAQRGVALIAQGRSRLGGDLWADVYLVAGLENAAEDALRVGDDPAVLLADATKAIDEGLARRPGTPALLELAGTAALIGARARTAAGQDPSARLDAGERLLARSVPKTGEDQGHRFAVEIALIGAHWKIVRGEDPGALLRKAQTEIAGEARRHPGWGNELVARAALEAALWARHSRRAADRDARRGLAALAPAIADDPRDAMLWLEKAELEALAGEAAAARASLAHAAELNRLVRGSHDWREAEAIVASPG